VETIEFKVGDKVKLVKHCYRGDPPYCDDDWTIKDRLQVGAIYTINDIVYDHMPCQWFKLVEKPLGYFYPSECFSKVREGCEGDRVLAEWHISLETTCPNCGEHVDLLDDPELLEEHNIEIGEHNTSKTEHMGVACPLCGEGFFVELIF
jgi:ribosomal protein S27AE